MVSKLPPDAIHVQVVQRLARQDAGIVDQDVDRAVADRRGQARRARVLGDVDALDDLDTQPAQVVGRRTGRRRTTVSPRSAAWRASFEADAAVGAGDDGQGHGNRSSYGFGGGRGRARGAAGRQPTRINVEGKLVVRRGVARGGDGLPRQARRAAVRVPEPDGP